MGFLGGLAGTLNKVIGQQAAIERDEASTIRKEDRAALAKFNAENNRETINGVDYFVLRGKDGIIAQRPVPQRTLDEEKSADLARSAKDVGSKDTIREDEFFTRGLADETIKDGTTKDDLKKDKDVTRDIGKLTQELKTKLPYDIAAEQRALGNDLTKQTHAGKIAAAKSGGLSEYAATVKAITTGILTGNLSLDNPKYTPESIKKLAVGVQKGVKGYQERLDTIMSETGTTITKKGTPKTDTTAPNIMPGAAGTGINGNTVTGASRKPGG